MIRRSLATYWILSLLVFNSFFAALSTAQGTLKSNRELMRGIAKGVHDIIQKNFYDPSLKGIDWNKELEETQKKIDATDKVGEMYAAIYWMVRKIDDSHTNFRPPEHTLEPRFEFRAKPYGETVRVYRVKENGVADKAGLRVGDTILGLEGMVANRKNYDDTLFYYRFIQPAAVLVLDLDRDGKRQRLEIPANVHTRLATQSALDFSKYYDWKREEETDYAEDPFEYGSSDGIGYVRLRDFIGDLAEKTLWKVKDSRALIIDLRGNPGGQIADLVRVDGYLEKNEAELFTLTDRGKSEKVMAKPKEPSFSDVPLAVLVDSESASSSEMLARHLQLTSRAVVIGDRTYGAVAASLPFSQKIGFDPAVFYGAQVTVGRVVFPDGKDLEKVGVTPDLKCIPEAADLVAKRDPCHQLAFNTLKAKLAAGSPGK
ncbi:MAG TPA: S41 family peptidase [Verrucomicrobiae bacterium]|nr:S41 family peptidase [Verrucomicrobiae bacterium]